MIDVWPFLFFHSFLLDVDEAVGIEEILARLSRFGAVGKVVVEEVDPLKAMLEVEDKRVGNFPRKEIFIKVETLHSAQSSKRSGKRASEIVASKIELNKVRKIGERGAGSAKVFTLEVVVRKNQLGHTTSRVVHVNALPLKELGRGAPILLVVPFTATKTFV